MTPEHGWPPREGKFMTPHGWANKYSLQELAAEAGLPVPEIYGLLIKNGKVQPDLLRPGEPLSRYFASSDSGVLVRGCVSHLADNFAIDYCPTEKADSIEKLVRLSQELMDFPVRFGGWELLDRFGCTDQKITPDFFIQKDVHPIDIIHVLTYAGCYYVNWGHPSKRGVTSFSYDSNHEILTSDCKFRLIEDQFAEQVLPLVDSASQVYNRQFSRRCNYHFEIGSDRKAKFWLFQTRIAGDEVNSERYEEMTNEVYQQNWETVKCDIGQGDIKIPETPYILQLSNSHKSEHTTPLPVSQLTNMRALILVSDRQGGGGFLMHDCYQTIAYALYHQIPVLFM